jgi:hypothetical protein
MKKVIRLTESDLTRIVKRVIKESSKRLIKESTSCRGEVYSSDICAPNDPGETPDIVYNIADQIADACSCFDNSVLTDWDEESFAGAISQIKDKKTFSDVQLVVSCYMMGAKQTGTFSGQVSNKPLQQLTGIMMDSWEGDLKQKVISILNKFK